MEFLTVSGMASFLARSRGHVYRRTASGYLLPAPVASGPTLRWRLPELEEYFDGTPVPWVACLVAADALAARELAEFGVYACPTDNGHHIGIERPSLLGLYSAGQVTVYGVDRVATSSMVGPQGAHEDSGLVEEVRARRQRTGQAAGNLAVFSLTGTPVGSYPTDDPIRHGLCLPADEVRAALAAPAAR